jgi:glycosyltransferase involved in cell wall biosynthesis
MIHPDIFTVEKVSSIIGNSCRETLLGEQRRISLVILTYNSSKTIGDCLAALKQVDYPSKYLEVIVIDNGSKDNTLEIIRKMGFNYYSYPGLNLPQLRNQGANICTGEIVGFVDSDCVIAPEWIKEVVKWFSDPTVGIVGNEYLLPENSTYFERNWYGKSNYGIQEKGLIPAGNMAVSRSLFFRLGGFDPSLLTGEDAYLLRKFREAGYRTISDHKIHAIHLGNAKSLSGYFKREIWYGLGMLGTVSSRSFDKAFFASNVYLLLLILFILSISFYGFSSDPKWVLGIFTVAMGLVGIPFCAAIERIYLKKIKGNFFYVTFTFVVFLLARINSLFYIYNLKRYQKN